MSVRSPWTLLRIWTAIGLQSFGGGASTQLLIRRAFVERRAWITSDELARYWSLCQFTPGINLISLTLLLGRRLGGRGGMVTSVAGMLLPSAAVTCLLAAGFRLIEHSPTVLAVLRGIVPATAGVMAVVAWGYWGPLWERAVGEGPGRTCLSLLLVVGTALAILLFRVPVALAVIAVAALGAALFTSQRAVPDVEESVGEEMAP